MSDHTALLARLEQRAIELDEFPFDAYQDTAALLREAIAALAPAKCALCGGLNPTHCNRCYGNVAYMTTPPADRGAAAPAPEGLAGLKKRDRLIARLEDMADDCAQGQRTSKTDRWRLTLVQAAAALRARSALSDEVLDDLVGWIRMSSKDEDGHHIYDLTVGEASDLVRAVLARQQEQGR